MDEAKLIQLENNSKLLRSQFGYVTIADKIDLLISEVRRLKAENERLDREISNLHMQGLVFEKGKLEDLKGLNWA